MFQKISIDDFEKRTGLVPQFAVKASRIVSLRDLNPHKVLAVQVMSRIYLEGLLRNIPLEGDANCKPYADCEITLVRMDPYDLVIGQTFVERGKYQSLLEDFGALLDGKFCVTRGTAKCNALTVFGQTYDGEDAVAHYLPPIIEATNGIQFLVDGIHRNFLVMRVGTTIESILLKNVKVPLPCEARSWLTINIVNAKPEREQRFYGLKPGLFRNLKYAGIDG